MTADTVVPSIPAGPRVTRPRRPRLKVQVGPTALDQRLATAIGHDDWCDYDDCEPAMGCGVWERVRRVKKVLAGQRTAPDRDAD